MHTCYSDIFKNMKPDIKKIKLKKIVLLSNNSKSNYPRGLMHFSY